MTDLEKVRPQVEMLRWVRERRAELKELEDVARAAVEEALGDSTEGTLDGHSAVAWRYHKRNALDQKVLRTSFPDIYEVCKRVTEIRRFEVLDD
jgi:predicted phage-related endonuclease